MGVFGGSDNFTYDGTNVVVSGKMAISVGATAADLNTPNGVSSFVIASDAGSPIMTMVAAGAQTTIWGLISGGSKESPTNSYNGQSPLGFEYSFYDASGWENAQLGNVVLNDITIPAPGFDTGGASFNLAIPIVSVGTYFVQLGDSYLYS